MPYISQYSSMQLVPGFVRAGHILYKSLFSCAVIFANLPKSDIPQVFIFASGHELVMSASGQS